MNTVLAHRNMLPLATLGSRLDPYATYRRLRALGPVQLKPFGLWVITSYEHAGMLVRSPAVSSENRNPLFELFFRGRLTEIRRTILFSDPPDHTRLRTLVSKAFTPRRVEALRPRVRQIADRLLAEATARDTRFDLLADFSYPLPMTVICEFLGVPVADRALFARWMRAIANRTNVQPALLLPWSQTMKRGERAVDDFTAYMLDLVSRRRSDPSDDFISALIAAEEEGDRLSADEVVAMAGLLLVGGFETVANLTANGMLALLRDPRQLERLHAEPGLIEPAIEELLRFDSPVQMVVRTAKENIDLGGHTIRAGQLILIILGAANRDPERFPDPDRLDLTRRPNPHLAFIAGHHFCLGAHLARLELQEAFAALLRLPDLRLTDPRPQWRNTIALRGLKSLPLRVPGVSRGPTDETRTGNPARVCPFPRP